MQNIALDIYDMLWHVLLPVGAAVNIAANQTLLTGAMAAQHDACDIYDTVTQRLDTEWAAINQRRHQVSGTV